MIDSLLPALASPVMSRLVPQLVAMRPLLLTIVLRRVKSAVKRVRDVAHHALKTTYPGALEGGVLIHACGQS